MTETLTRDNPHASIDTDRVPSGGGEAARWAADAERTLRATIIRGLTDTWFVRLTGDGYPVELILGTPTQARERMPMLVEEGFEIVDPLHYCDIFDIFPGEPISQYADSRDAAEGPAVAMVGSGPGDSGRGRGYVQRGLELQDAYAMGEIECAYLRTIEPEF